MSTATKRTSAAKKAAPKAAAKSVEARAQENTERTTSTPDATAARGSAIMDPTAEIASSADAAEQRQGQAATAESAKAADEATPLTFPEGAAVNQAGIENLAVLESRERAKRVGDAAMAAADPTAAEKGKATLRTVQKPAVVSAGAPPFVDEYDEIAVPAPDGIHEVVFTRQPDGGVELSMQNVHLVNSMRGGAHTTIVKLTEEAWSTIVDTLPGTQAPGEQLAPAQSAAEQRQGAGEGAAVGGPVAPHPVTL